MTETLKIGELATHTGCPIARPSATTSARGCFRPRFDLLRFRDAPQDNCDGANQLLDQPIDHVAERIADLNMLARQLKSLRPQCGEANAARECGILNKLAETIGATGVRVFLQLDLGDKNPLVCSRTIYTAG